MYTNIYYLSYNYYTTIFVLCNVCNTCNIIILINETCT